MTPVEQLTVALIRALNSAVLSEHATDREVMQMYGPAATPLAEALAAVVRDEVARQLDAEAT